MYVYPSTLSPSLSLSTAHSSPVTPLSPPRYRSTPLSGSSPLFVTAVSPLKHCVPSLSLSSFSPTCSFRRSQSTLLRPLVSSALRFSLRLAESSFLPDPPPCIFGRWIRRNGSTTPFVPELGRVRMRRLTSTGENRDWSPFYANHVPARPSLTRPCFFFFFLFFFPFFFFFSSRVLSRQRSYAERNERRGRESVIGKIAKERSVGWVCRVETIGRVLFSLSNLCTIFRYRKLKRFAGGNATPSSEKTFLFFPSLFCRRSFEHRARTKPYSVFEKERKGRGKNRK